MLMELTPECPWLAAAAARIEYGDGIMDEGDEVVGRMW